MVKEFEKFGKHKGIAKKLVDKDDLVLTNKLYSNLNKFTSRTFVSYNPDFWSGYDFVKKYSEPIMIATRIMLYNQDNKKDDGYHAVCILKQRRQFYLFDPNGYMNAKQHSLIYTDHNGKPIDGPKFSKKYGISLPKYEGIQSIAPGNEKIPNGYINEGGYCMFYLYIGLMNVLKIYETSKESIVTICKKITDTKSLTTLLKYFPEDVHLKTKLILKDVFG
tara:strand:+ start:5555 stop:6214 length:660 start_codon:yes stop_codon:yes gene_type:complete